jgi:hypothetical protein
MFWLSQRRGDSTPLRATAAMSDPCSAQARDVHKAYTTARVFPLYWQLIDNDVNKLTRIFQFFCRMEECLIQSPRQLVQLLHCRLFARYSGGPPLIPFEFTKIILDSAHGQLKEFQVLGNDLLEPAFVLFVTGSLNPTRRPHFAVLPTAALPNPLAPDATREYPEPNSAIFFYWAEFAFLAAGAGHEPAAWKKILQVLIRAERIFVHCYGGVRDGKVPPERKFDDYQNFIDKLFSQLHPDEAKKIPTLLTERFDELENEATKCTRFAFPGGFATTPTCVQDIRH